VIYHPSTPLRIKLRLTHWKIIFLNACFAELCYNEAINPPIIADMGFNVLLVGSTSTPKFSKAVAPTKNNESFGAKITGQGKVPVNPSI